MIKEFFDTIVAISTPKGTGGISIIRLSGRDSLKIAESIIDKKIIKERINRVSIFDINKNLLDFGIILFFKKPKSFTGEDLIEFHVHGSQIITETILSNIIKIGARLANPGEFSLRSYLNGKIDLIQAESINLLINSKNLFRNELILKSLSGSFSKELKMITEKIFLLRQLLEGSIEFPDDLQNISDNFIKDFSIIKYSFDNLYEKLYKNDLIDEKFKIAIIGNVNAGKSSLFNLLLKNERSIISNVPGTTRDFIEDEIELSGTKINLIDTAGFNRFSKCDIEKTGIEKTLEQINKSSVIIYMIDITKENDENEFLNFLKSSLNEKIKIFLLKNKIDIKNINENIFYHEKYTEILISVKENKGINIFINELKKIIFNVKDKIYITNKKNYSLFKKIKENFSEIYSLNKKNNFLDIKAEILKNSHNMLLEIIGEKASDDLIKEIFAKFCVGK